MIAGLLIVLAGALYVMGETSIWLLPGRCTITPELFLHAAGPCCMQR